MNHTLFITVLAQDREAEITIKKNGILVRDSTVISGEQYLELSELLAWIQKSYDFNMIPHQGTIVGYAMFGVVTEDIITEVIEKVYS